MTKARIDETLEFYPLNLAVLTVSDTRDESTDTSGGLLVERAAAAGHAVVARQIVKDEVSAIRGSDPAAFLPRDGWILNRVSPCQYGNGGNFDIAVTRLCWTV